MAKKVVTLFIDDTDIRLLVAKGKQVQKWARLPLEPGLVSDGVILDEAQMADKLRELFELSKITPGRIIVGISGLNSLYRIVSLPALPEAVMAEAVKHEARRVIPVSLDQVYLSYQPLPSPKGETRLFLVAFPKNTADVLVRALRQIGVDPYLMDLAPLALCRNANEPRAIIVNAWLTHLDIVIMTDRVPQVIRSLSLVGEATSLSDILPTITEELNRTITFYNSGHMETPLDATVPILVSGDLAEAPDSWQSLAGSSGYPVAVLSSPMEYPEGFNPNQFMVNMGLALKELFPEKGTENFSLVNFNALPEVYRPKVRPLSQTLIPAGAAVGIGLLIFSVFLVQSSITRTETLRSQLTASESLISQQQQEIVNLKTQINQAETLMAPTEATAGVFSTTFTDLEQVRERVDEDLHEIVSLKPADVDLTEVNHDSEVVTVSGVVPEEDRNDIFAYARSLRGSGRFPTVIILSIAEEISGEEETEEFSFVFLLKNGG